MPSKKEFILSEKYADIILPIYSDFLEEYAEWGAQIFNSYYGMIHYPLEERNSTQTFMNMVFFITQYQNCTPSLTQ